MCSDLSSPDTGELTEKNFSFDILSYKAAVAIIVPRTVHYGNDIEY